jgi:hypothetical protein
VADGVVGDAQFLLNDFRGAHDYFRYALQAPDGTGNGFVWLRLGQCLALLGDKEAAVDPLARAYMLEGAEIFEDADPEFLRLATSRLSRRLVLDEGLHSTGFWGTGRRLVGQPDHARP